jgi:hypothetical protein
MVPNRVATQALILAKEKHRGDRPLMDRPFIRYLIDFLEHHGILSIDFNESCTEQALHGSEKDLILLGCPDLIPTSSMLDQSEPADPSKPVLFYAPTEAAAEWIGWAMLPGKLLRHVSGSNIERLDHTRVVLDDADEILSFRSGKSILQAHHRILDGDRAGIHPPGRQIKKGIWISDPVKIHPSARLFPPVWIGANARIELGAQIGPIASIGSGCLIKRHSLVENSVVMPDSFVGESLELNSVIVDQGLLINTRLATETIVADPFILCGTGDLKPAARLARSLRKLSGSMKRKFTSR